MQNMTDAQDLCHIYLAALAGEAPAQAPVVLVHGFAQHASSWDAIARELRAQGRNVYAVELEAYTLDDMVAEVANTTRNATELAGQRAILVGYSMGGRIALEFALRKPDAFNQSVGRLILESAGLGPADDLERSQIAERNAAWAQRLRTEGLAAFMDYWENLPLFASQKELPDEVRARIRRARLDNDAEALAAQLEQAGAHRMTGAPAARAFLSSAENAEGPLHKPTSWIYLAGEQDPKYQSIARTLEQASPHHTLTVPKTGHNIHQELFQ